MKSTRVLITGATGFVGRAVCKRLFACKQFDVLAFSRVKNIDEDNISWRQVDLSNPESYIEEVRKFQPEVVLHLAWQDIPDFSLEKCFLNLKNSINLLSSVFSVGSCRKVIVSGSCFELINPSGRCSSLNEGGIKDAFTWAKQSLRYWLNMEAVARGINFGWFRIFYVYGPGQRSASLLPTILKAYGEGKQPALRSPFDANDYVFVDDVARAFVAGIDKKLPNGILNIGSGSSIKNIDISKIAQKLVLGANELLGRDERIISAPGKFLSDFFADIADTTEYLGWLPLVSLEDGIYEMLNLQEDS